MAVLLHADFAADYDEIIAAITRFLRVYDKDRGLVAIVLAQRSHPFASDNILPLVPYWHYRSDDSMLFVFPGYMGSPSDIGSRYASVISNPDVFSEVSFVEVLRRLEAETSFRYSGRTTVILTVAIRGQENESAHLDTSAFLDFDLEGAIKDGLIDDARVAFESIIAVARDYQGDAALWGAKAGLQEGFEEEALLGLFEKYLPVPKGVKTYLRGRLTFRVKDRRPERAS